MTIAVSYMGTKLRLAPQVATLVARSRGGDFLDLFAGMCSVAAAIGAGRQLWTNDLQVFSREVATARFRSQDQLISPLDAASLCSTEYRTHRANSEKRLKEKLRVEQRALSRGHVNGLKELLNDAIEDTHKCDGRRLPKYSLFSSYFGGSYFGVMQSIEIDSIRCSIDRELVSKRISKDQHRWLLIALCVALSKCASTTGHFAQPLAPKSSNLRRFMAQRQRSIWVEWMKAIGNLTPVGGRDWRRRNRVFQTDAIALLARLPSRHRCPSVIYADPPYTKDQYSRYYHIYETAILYDYPGSSGTGQYRLDRPASEFCMAARVESAFASLIEKSAALGSDLIISYPTNGLLPDSRHRIPDMIKRFYRRSADCTEVEHTHSTMGASKGVAQSSVTEVLYRVSRRD